MTAEFALEMQKTMEVHQNEVDELKRQLLEASTRVDRSLTMPRRVPSMEEAEV